jgi:hypothetical protein
LAQRRCMRRRQLRKSRSAKTLLWCHAYFLVSCLDHMAFDEDSRWKLFCFPKNIFFFMTRKILGHPLGIVFNNRRFFC